MARKLSEYSLGIIYQIIQRGNNRNYIYSDISDKFKFLELLEETIQKHEFTLLYYVLMDNHYHLLIEAGEIELNTAIKWLNQKYSLYYNAKYNRVGTIYGGRYSSTVVSDSRYFYQLVRYIANNPLRAGIVENIRNYRWGCHQSIANGDPSIVDTEKMLKYFNGNGKRAFKLYMDFVELIGDVKLHDIDPKTIAKKTTEEELDFIIKSMGLCDIDFQLMRRGERIASLAPSRSEFIKTAFTKGYSISEISNHISLSYEGVRKVIRGQVNF